MGVETIAVVAERAEYRQSVGSNHLKGSFTADDTDAHDFVVRSRGKGNFTVAVDNPANQNLALNIYGMETVSGTVGDAQTFLISGSPVAVNTTLKSYTAFDGRFPFYLVRIAYGIAPTDNPLKTCSVWINFTSS